MELFNKRYFCFICFSFVLTAFLLTFFGATVKITVGIIFLIALIVSAVVFLKTKKDKFKALFSLLICFAVSASSFSSYFFISRAEEEAASLIGENTVYIRVISQNGEDEYNARLLQVGDKKVNIKSELLFDGSESFEYGDEIVMNADIDFAYDVRDRSKLLAVAMCENSKVYVNKAESKNYFSIDGIMALSHSLQEKFSIHVDRVFGDHAALAKGLLVNDTRDIDTKTETDFKRSGTSHILAVSGMHIALLMGALELLLRKVRVKKEIRIIIISITSIFFLALTGFVASAVRSVLMLFAVYLCYMLYEENDSITALFASVAIIILFSPFSVYDLGMWMSFLATLGILAVYPYFDERMPYPKQENLFVRYSLRLLVWIAKTLMLTVVANFFLLPIMWCFFGVASISTFPCNLILGPVVTILMPLCAIATLLGFIPYVSVPFVFLTNKLLDVMMAVVRYFSEMRFGVVSLQYEFAGILITLFAITLTIMLVIKFKHKLIVFIPMATFLLAFTVCFSIFNYNSKPTVQCVKVYDSEIVYVNRGAECSVIDVGKGNALKGNSVLKYMSKYATEIDEYFIIEPNKNHAKILNEVCENTIIRKILIPNTVENEDFTAIYDVLICAEKYNIDVEMYEKDINVEICNSVSFNYISCDEFSVFSNDVKLKKQDGEMLFEYGGQRYEVGYNNRCSKVVPLN